MPDCTPDNDFFRRKSDDELAAMALKHPILLGREVDLAVAALDHLAHWEIVSEADRVVAQHEEALWQGYIDRVIAQCTPEMVARIFDGLDAAADGLDRRAAEMREQAVKVRAAKSVVEAAALKLVDANGGPIDGEAYSLRAKVSKRVAYPEPSQIPEDCLRWTEPKPAEQKPDGKKIRKRLLAGEAVPGCALSEEWGVEVKPIPPRVLAARARREALASDDAAS